jgi:hypothetical protein
MNRTSAAALAVAAVIGVTGGSYAASGGLFRDDDKPEVSDNESPGPSTPGSPTESEPSPRSPAQLLYMDAEEIHDGYTRVPVGNVDITHVSSLVRVSGGWLVVTSTSPQEPAFRGTLVAADGRRTDLGEFFGVWDIDEDGSMFVAQREEGYGVTNLENGAILDLDLGGPAGASTTAEAAFVGDAVLTGWASNDGNRIARRTDLGTGKSRELTLSQISGWTASPRGLLVTGETLEDDRPCLRGGRVLGTHADWWQTCDWLHPGLRPQYSPNGEQLLVIPTATDGFGPGLFGVLDSENGRVLDEVDAPDWTTHAEWGDNDEVFLLGQKTSEDVTAVIHRCKLGGPCTRERESKQRLVLGVGT